MTSPFVELMRALAVCSRTVIGRPVVLALDRHSADGKSTLAKTQTTGLSAAVIPVDDFYRDDQEEVRLVYNANDSGMIRDDAHPVLIRCG